MDSIGLGFIDNLTVSLILFIIFSVLLYGNINESDKPEVNIKEASITFFKILLVCIYTSQMNFRILKVTYNRCALFKLHKHFSLRLCDQLVDQLFFNWIIMFIRKMINQICYFFFRLKLFGNYLVFLIGTVINVHNACSLFAGARLNQYKKLEVESLNLIENNALAVLQFEDLLSFLLLIMIVICAICG